MATSSSTSKIVNGVEVQIVKELLTTPVASKPTNDDGLFEDLPSQVSNPPTPRIDSPTHSDSSLGNSTSNSPALLDEFIPTFDYDVLDDVIEYYNDFLNNSVRDCFENLVQIVTGFQFACVFNDHLIGMYNANQLLRLSQQNIVRHYQIQERLSLIKDKKFTKYTIVYLTLLKDFLEDEIDDYHQFNRENSPITLTLGTLEDTKLFRNRIKNLLRNGKHLKYISISWYNALVRLFKDINRLPSSCDVHFKISRYHRDEFIQYFQEEDVVFEHFSLLPSGEMPSN